MSGLVVFSGFVLLVLACLGLFMSGLAAMRRLRLSRHRANLRFIAKSRARRRAMFNNLQQREQLQ